METFENINEVLYQVNTDIVRRKRNPLLPIVLAVCGVALTLWSLQSEVLADRANLAAVLLFFGIVLILVGVVATIRAFTSSRPYYRPTGERLYRSERFFDQKDKRALCDALENGQAEAVAALPRSETSGVVLTIFSTRSGSCVMVQAAEYIPHHFVPITSVLTFTQEQGKIMRSLA